MDDGRWVMEKDEAGPQIPTHIRYIELRGEGAYEKLLALQQSLSLCPGFIDAALLHSEEQGLWLLESRWAGPVSEVALPAGAKAWGFKVRVFVRNSL